MEQCANCNFWVPDKKYNFKKGFCTKLTSSDAENKIEIWTDWGLDLWTYPSFGCVLFEQKTKGSGKK